MTVNYNSVSVNVDNYSGAKQSVVILHGWGANISVMKCITDFLVKNGHNVTVIDFPGFGKSDMPKPEWGIYDYADCIEHVLKELKITKPLIIGHSFGGRVAIILGSRNTASALVLTASAGIKPRFSLKTKLKIAKYKIAKKFIKNLKSGSNDYKALPDNMKGVFIRVVNTHLHKEMKEIDVPTLLIWGNNDSETPLYMAKRMNNLIKTSGLSIIDSCGHFVFLDNPIIFNRALASFIQSVYGG